MNSSLQLITNNWAQIGLSVLGKEYTLRVVQSAPSREAGNGSGRNIRVDYASRKMGHTMGLESATIEAAYALLLDFAISCIGFYAQPESIAFELVRRDGVKARRWITFDFLVVYPGRVELVECKREGALIELSDEPNPLYFRSSDGSWSAPEIVAQLKQYGLGFRVITDTDLPPVLIRNYNLLSEASNMSYSSTGVLELIRDQIALSGGADGAPLSALLANVGQGYGKNDIYFGLLVGDLRALLDMDLLVDTKTTRIFACAGDAMRHRLLHVETKAILAKPITVQDGDRILWNKKGYTVCNVSEDKLYLRSDGGDLTPVPRQLAIQFLKTGEMEFVAKPLLPSSAQQQELEPYLRVLTKKKEALAAQKSQFLAAREKDPLVVPKNFGLNPVSKRTIERWVKQARESLGRWRTEFWGMCGKPRTGRPRNELPEEIKNDIAAVAKELYFDKTHRSLSFCWREHRRRRESEGKLFCSVGAFRRCVRTMENTAKTLALRNGENAAYPHTYAEGDGKNWLMGDDYPYKLGHLDCKLLKVGCVDDETGEYLGRPWLASLVLPFLGCAPAGFALLFEPPSYRLATLAVRDAFRRRGEMVKYLFVDNGSEFQNTIFDQTLAILGCSRCDRPPRNARYGAQIESYHKLIDTELTNNIEGNTQALKKVRELTCETDPELLAVWPLSKLYDVLEHYLITMLWTAPSAALGTTPENKLKLSKPASPDRSAKFVVPEGAGEVLFFPEVRGITRMVRPGRGIYVHGYYYRCPEMDYSHIEKSDVVVRYDPYELYFVYAAIDGKWVKCEATRAPELRNMTERYRHLYMLARRRLKDTHAERRDSTHGRRLAELGKKMCVDEKLLKEQRKERAQRMLQKGDAVSPPKPSSLKVPKISLRHLRSRKAA